MASTSASLEEYTESLDGTQSDLESATSYSSVGTTNTSLHPTSEPYMAEPRRITLHEQGAPDIVLQPLQARYPNLDPNFELKTRKHGADEVAIMVFAFPFSLEAQAKTWFYLLPDEIATNWDFLRREFLDKFFPPEKTDYIRKEISGTMQRDQESLYEYWSRFKRLLESCPHHGMNTHLLISYFTGGLCVEDRRLLTASSGGSLSKNKTEGEAWSLIKDWRDNAQGNNQNQRWNNSSSHHNNNESSSQYHHNNNNYQANQNHHNQNQNNYTKYQAPHHRQQTNQASSPPTNQVDELRAAVDKWDEGYKAQFEALSAQLANLTDMILKMSMSSSNNTNQPSSSSNLPFQPQPNPKGGLNAITLQSRTTLEEIPSRVLEDIHEEEVIVEAPHEKEEVDKRHEEEGVNLKEPKKKALVDESIPISFPSMVKKAKKTPEFDLNMLQVFKKVEVTIPLLDAIQQIPKFAKFLKDLCTHKDMIGELETLSLGSSISSLMEPIPKKYGDPGSCLVSCCIGGHTFHDRMCDLGACISIMPLSTFVQLNLAPLKKSAARFALVDKCDHGNRNSRRCTCGNQGFDLSG
ncbi:uncharacterized protein LOC107472068 [Arachis duranensis]|uniref:Uncharacterized protein LOC107472068 n=1 Tax=Arachis duranensis TaxID=130453 RepID=A0A6P4BSE9_ARADU|nr:uncharacterized protein LOC107472068 [Arachis duranensis]